MCLFGCSSDSGKQARDPGSGGASGNRRGSGGGGGGGACATCCATFSIDSETVATQPANRQRRRIGIGEEVELTTNPSESVTWTIEADDGQKGTLSTATGTSTTYTACDRAKSVTIKGRNHCGNEATVLLAVVEPSAGRFGAETDISAFAGANVTVGFRAPPAMMPNDVSFYNCEMREGTCPAAASGIYAHQAGMVHADTGSWVQFSSTVGTDGTELGGSDTVSTTNPLAWMPAGGTTDGRFHWPIPWRAQVQGGGTNGAIVFDTLDHVKSYTASSRILKVEKGNRSAQRTIP